ncbi:MAG: DUF4340 domain-containing protein [Thiohalocapsa sp.]
MSESILKNAERVNPLRLLDPSWLQALKTPLVIALGAVLAMQVLIGLLLSGESGMAPVAKDVPLLSFDPETVTTIEIEGGDGDGAVRLARTDDGWSLPDLDGFPVSAARVTQLIDGLRGLGRPLPVATSDAARGRFRVADDAFERRLTLRGENGGIATLLVGDSPGFRRLFVRVDGDDAIYDVRLALFDLSANSDDWLERGRLQLNQADISRVATGDWTLIKEEDDWRLDGSDREPNADVVDDLLADVSSLGYLGVLGTEDKPEYGLGDPALTLDIGLKDGASRAYRIGRIQDSEDYALNEGSSRYYYRVAASALDGLFDLNADGLLGQDPKDMTGDQAPDQQAPHDQAPVEQVEAAPQAEAGTEPVAVSPVDATGQSSAAANGVVEVPGQDTQSGKASPPSQ